MMSHRAKIVLWPLFSTFMIAVTGSHAAATQIVMRSTHSYWNVGERDTNLSMLCSIGRFNQREDNLYVAQFEGRGTKGEDTGGKAVLGIAKGNGANLYDPTRAAKPKEDYFFLGDGTSDCTVFVGGRPKKKPAPPTVPVDSGAPPAEPPSVSSPGTAEPQ
jgi:hypothetical protein